MTFRRFHQSLVAVAVAILALQFADVATTHLLLQHANAYEGNPLARFLLGSGALLEAKLALALVIVLAAVHLRRVKLWVLLATTFAAGLYAAVCLSNALSLLAVGK